MASHSEQVLLSNLTSAVSLDVLAREGFMTPRTLKMIPTKLIQEVTAWALDLFFKSGRTIPPSREAITTQWGKKLEAMDLKIDDEYENDTVDYAILELRSRYFDNDLLDWTHRMTDAIYRAVPQEKSSVAVRMFSEGQAIVQTAARHRDEMTGLQGIDDAIFRLKERQANGNKIVGLKLGLPMIDDHMFGLHDGEILTVAAASSTGKSFLAGHITCSEFDAGRRVMLATLENDVYMTFDRLICLHEHVDYEQWQRGTITSDEEHRVNSFRDRMAMSDCQPVIVQMAPDESTPNFIVHRAQMEGAQSLIVDQVSFVRPDSGSSGKRFEGLAEIMRSFKELVRYDVPMPLVLMNQINREGVANARKVGRYFKEHMADGASIEQFSDFVLALYQSDLMYRERTIQFQQLKARRTTIRHHQGTWRPEVGHVTADRVIDLALFESKKSDE